LPFARSHLTHHWRFYACFIFGAAVYLVLGDLSPPVRLLAGGDAFFASYVAMLAFLALRITPKQLDKKADVEDEGIFLVILFALVMIGFCLFALVMIGFCLFAIVTLLHQKHGVDPFAIALAVAGAPLGWAMLHMMMAFHYAYLFYSEPGKKAGSGLIFPGTAEPGAADFLYYAFVVGMTFQVSDVQVTSTRLRRMTLAHSIVSFFFNTCLIAMAVNAVVAIAA
jgi:uncharacterized membrane protein